MKTYCQQILYVLVATALSLGAVPPESRREAADSGGVAQAYDEAVAAQPKLLRIACRVDGSGRVVFTRERVHYEHKHWRRPDHVLFDGEPWTNLGQTPVPWTDYGHVLDLSKAWIVKRKGRDVISLEHTPDGFDLYLSDSPNGAGDYAVTIAIPRRR